MYMNTKFLCNEQIYTLRKNFYAQNDIFSKQILKQVCKVTIFTTLYLLSRAHKEKPKISFFFPIIKGRGKEKDVEEVPILQT